MTDNTIHIIRFRPRQYGDVEPRPDDSYLILETGFYLLTEENDKIILENGE